jgi:hypothetical protein
LVIPEWRRAYPNIIVLVNGTDRGVQSNWTFSNITERQTIWARFIPDTFDITASAGCYGRISPAGVTAVAPSPPINGYRLVASRSRIASR